MSLFSRLSQIQRAPAGGEDDVAVLAANGSSGEEETVAVPPIHRRSKIDKNSTASIENVSKKSLKEINAKAGVLLKTLKPGDITNFPKKGDICTIHYEAFTEDEIICNSRNRTPVEPFDSSRSRDQVFQFRLGAGSVIEGMDVAVSKMSLGQEVEATIPYPYAYGVAGYPPVVPPRATLIFRIELISFSSVV